MIIKDILKGNARRYPDRTAIVFKDARYTFKEFNDRVNSLANALTNMDLRKGDWVATVTDSYNQLVERCLRTKYRG